MHNILLEVLFSTLLTLRVSHHRYQIWKISLKASAAMKLQIVTLSGFCAYLKYGAGFSSECILHECVRRFCSK